MSNKLREEFKKRYERAEQEAEVARDLIEDPRFKAVFGEYFGYEAERWSKSLVNYVLNSGDDSDGKFRGKAYSYAFRSRFFTDLKNRPREMINAFEKGAKEEKARIDKEAEGEE